MAQNLIPVTPPAFRARTAAQGRNGHLIDQVTEKRRLREDLGVEKRRRRLQRNGLDLLEAMQPAR
jgi:hypothetical protein